MEYTHYNITYGKLKIMKKCKYLTGYKWYKDVYNSTHILSNKEVINHLNKINII